MIPACLNLASSARRSTGSSTLALLLFFLRTPFSLRHTTRTHDSFRVLLYNAPVYAGIHIHSPRRLRHIKVDAAQCRLGKEKIGVILTCIMLEMQHVNVFFLNSYLNFRLVPLLFFLYYLTLWPGAAMIIPAVLHFFFVGFSLTTETCISCQNIETRGALRPVLLSVTGYRKWLGAYACFVPWRFCRGIWGVRGAVGVSCLQVLLLFSYLLILTRCTC